MRSGERQGCDVRHEPVPMREDSGGRKGFHLRLGHLERLADIGARRGRVVRRRERRLFDPSWVVGLVPSTRKEVLYARFAEGTIRMQGAAGATYGTAGFSSSKGGMRGAHCKAALGTETHGEPDGARAAHEARIWLRYRWVRRVTGASPPPC